MFAIGMLQEHTTTTTADISWLVWVVLALFLLMVLLGWWASGRLPNEEEAVAMHEAGQEHASHGDAVADQEMH